MTDYSICTTCGAKGYCIEACEPGSIMCMANRMRSGKTKEDILRDQSRLPEDAKYCPVCGRSLKVIGSERFCRNPQCTMHFKKV